MTNNYIAHMQFNRPLYLLRRLILLLSPLDPNQPNASDGIDLHLQRSNKLLDDHFVFIKRDENKTKIIDDYNQLAEQYSDCFYHNENSAIDVCDGTVVCIHRFGSMNFHRDTFLPLFTISTGHFSSKFRLYCNLQSDRLAPSDNNKPTVWKNRTSKSAMNFDRQANWIFSSPRPSVYFENIMRPTSLLIMQLRRAADAFFLQHIITSRNKNKYMFSCQCCTAFENIVIEIQQLEYPLEIGIIQWLSLS